MKRRQHEESLLNGGVIGDQLAKYVFAHYKTLVIFSKAVPYFLRPWHVSSVGRAECELESIIKEM